MSFVVTYPPIPATASPEMKAFLEVFRLHTQIYLNSLKDAQFTIAAGTNITLSTSGTVITITATGGGASADFTDMAMYG